MGPIKVENIIVASHLGKEVELIKLATELPDAKYSSSGNPSVIIEMDASNNKKAAGVLFGNGKIIVTGITSLEKGKEIILGLRKMVKTIDTKVSIKRAIKLENMVVRSNLGKTLDLQAIALAIPGSEYDPTRFKGLILRMEEPDASFILFESGVLIITDIVSEAKAKKALKALEKFMADSGIAS